MIEAIQNRDYMLNQYKKEIEILEQLCFKQIDTNIYKFDEGDYVLFIDYRSGKRRSWSISISDAREKTDKTKLVIYKIFKELVER